ncbi:hypothetical protein M427DRAFT_58466 [Gonapodya prolifera JEL478]|uniref:Vps72/YL1 C-terminal domain-containing protein n=1 Tax=Gonapodya prolifera (strain JEL478) TaxID=1344416 RepID=A0A139AAD4_GONPJ|nr:hypothetical protein M427DRAFT_58466 [Gonapodya prolifera JEL478]|eukprot:KXS13649.1 hypothetical protein M427DRAFT_58466 [Gonapodya prolifera JEL478]
MSSTRGAKRPQSSEDDGHQKKKKGKDVVNDPEPGSVSPLDLASVSKPFKNPDYEGPKKFKNLKQILAAEKLLAAPLNAVTYSNIQSAPTLLPVGKYCDITGLEAKYTDPKTGLRYHSADLYMWISRLQLYQVQKYLSLRGAAVRI